MHTSPSRQWVLARHIRELPQVEDFRLETVQLPPPGEGELRVRTLYASVDPGALSRLGGVASYAPPLGRGEAMTGAAVGEVLESRHEGLAPGDRVVGSWGWREHAVVGGGRNAALPRARGGGSSTGRTLDALVRVGQESA